MEAKDKLFEEIKNLRPIYKPMPVPDNPNIPRGWSPRSDTPEGRALMEQEMREIVELHMAVIHLLNNVKDGKTDKNTVI
jgi:hypothetical protein